MIAALPSDLPDMLAEQVRDEARQRLESEIARLPETFRVPLILKDIVGLSAPEIAAIMDIRLDTVRSRVHRARLKLRDAVDRVFPRDPEPATTPAYPRRACLDLLNAKQDTLDRGVPFDTSVICRRCRSVFASLDLTRDLCHELASGRLPRDVLQHLEARLNDA